MGWKRRLRRAVPASTGGRIVAAAIVAVLLAVGTWFLVGDGLNATSAEHGREGTRSFDGTPDDLPPDVVPADAVEVEGTVARGGDDWSSAVTFIVEGDREDVMPTVDAAVLADGYTLRQRAYDDEVMQVVYDRSYGAVLTVTYRAIPEGTGTAVVLVSP